MASVGLPAHGARIPLSAHSAAGLPRSGRYAFLVTLALDSTLTRYQAVLGSGGSRRMAAAAGKTQFALIKQAQARVVAAAARALPDGSVLYRTHSVLSAVAFRADVRDYPALSRLPGVTGVYPIAPKTTSNGYAIPLEGGPAGWTAQGDLGAHSTVAIIDTGIDYTHADFGGPGTQAAYTTARATDTSPADPSLFPSAKVIGGYDLAGDAYTGGNAPAPDPNPLDCAGHGTHVAGTLAGYGVTANGTTYPGPWDTSTPFSSMRIGPGMAPQASLYSYKVFGCSGGTTLVAGALDMAADPNSDGDPSDHVNVVNMSLGADFGTPYDGDAIATNAAVALGITVVVAAGNAGDVQDVGGSPGDAPAALAVASSVDASNRRDGVTVQVDANPPATYAAQRSVRYDFSTQRDLAGTVVAPGSSDLTGCSAFGASDAALISGNVAFLEWNAVSVQLGTECGSATRAANVAAAGGTGFVLANSVSSFLSGILGSSAIPGVLVSQSGGDAIRSALASAAAVHVVSSGAGSYDVLDPTLNDTLSSFSSRGIHAAGNLKPDVTAVGDTVYSAGMGTGNAGFNFSGTSMATPMVAGVAALVTSLHPDWTPLEVKADIMDTAGQDLSTGPSHTGTVYAPNRVGTGRIDTAAALANQVVAYVTQTNGAVGVSFGGISVTGPTTLTKTVTIVNTSPGIVSYDLAYTPVDSLDGATFTVSPSTVTLAALSSTTVTVSLVVSNDLLLAHSIDPTMSPQASGFPIDYLASMSGHLDLTPTGPGPSLRVAVYAAVRPASTMTQQGAVTTTNDASQTVNLTLTGNGRSQGGASAQVQSLVNGYELQAVSARLPVCSATVTTGCAHNRVERGADIRFVGVSTSVGQQLVNFAVTTYGPRQTAATEDYIQVSIDTNADGVPDFYVVNDRYNGSDVFIATTYNSFGQVVDQEFLDDPSELDHANFDSDVIVLPVTLAALGLSSGASRFTYGVSTFAQSAPGPSAFDAVGVDPVSGNLASPLTFDPLNPGVQVGGDPNAAVFNDQPGTLPITRTAAPYATDQALGVLMVHFLNAVGDKAQVVRLRAPAQSVTLSLTATSVPAGTPVPATSTVSIDYGHAPTGTVQIVTARGTVLTSAVLDSSGTAQLTIPGLPAGSYTLHARYLGDHYYVLTRSVIVRLTVT